MKQINPRPPKLPNHTNKNGEFFQCSECTKGFAERRRYNQHLKTHTKPFRCENCSRGFALRSDLSRHIKTRHRVAQQRHPCPFDGCSFGATRKDNLNQHIRCNHGAEMLSSSGHITTRCAIGNDKTKANALNVEQDVTSDLKHGPNTAPHSIFIAAAAGNQVLLEQLYSSGADMHVVADDGCNALHAAARAGREQTARYLLGLGVPSVVNENSRLPVHEAALSGDWSTLKLLLEHRKILPETSKANYPTACCSFLIDLVLKSEQCDMIRNWIEYTGLDIIKDKKSTILHHAAQLKDVSGLGTLLSYKVLDINELDSEGYAPIHYAARNRNTDLLRQMLLQPDIKVNEVSQRRQHRKEVSALQIAIRRNNLDIFNMLLEDHRLCWRGGLDAPTMELQTCKDYCRWNMWKLLIRHHWDDGTNNECLLLNASLDGEENKVIELLAQGSSTYHDYPNPLHCAIAAGHDNIAQLLLKRAKGIIHGSPWKYFKPIDVAVSNIDERMVSFLLENSGSLHLGTYDLTPEVMYHGSLSMVKMLFSWSGFDPGCIIRCLQYRRVKDTQTLKLLFNDSRVTTEIKENPKRYPLMHYAVRCAGTECVELLFNDRIRPYIDINATEYSWSEWTALDVAIQKKRTDLIGLLRSHGAKTWQELKAQEEVDNPNPRRKEDDPKYERDSTLSLSEDDDFENLFRSQTIGIGNDMDDDFGMETGDDYPHV